jgi:hypothetical protein
MGMKSYRTYGRRSDYELTGSVRILLWLLQALDVISEDCWLDADEGSFVERMRTDD